MNLPKKPESYFEASEIGKFFPGKNRGQSSGVQSAHG